MSIPKEIKIGILGAGGKMGMRIGANLKKLPNEIFYIENAEAGIKRLNEIGIEVSAPTAVMGQLDFLILAVPDLYINKITTEVVPDMKSDAIVLLLDPAAAYMNQVCIREDLHYTVIHPCHPALSKISPRLRATMTILAVYPAGRTSYQPTGKLLATSTNWHVMLSEKCLPRWIKYFRSRSSRWPFWNLPSSRSAVYLLFRFSRNSWKKWTSGVFPKKLECPFYLVISKLNSQFCCSDRIRRRMQR